MVDKTHKKKTSDQVYKTEKKKTSDQVYKTEKREKMEKIYDEYQREYSIIEGYIPKKYSIWNAHLLEVEGKTFLKLYNNETSNGCTVDDENLLALEVSCELGKIIDNNIAGGRNPKEVKRYLKSKSNYRSTKAETIKPYIERLFNTKI